MNPEIIPKAGVMRVGIHGLVRGFLFSVFIKLGSSLGFNK